LDAAVAIAVERSSPGALAAAWLETQRERWFCWVPVLFGLGIALYFWLPVEPQLGVALAIGVGGIVTAVMLRRDTVLLVIGGSVLAVSLGLAVAKLRTERVRAPVLERAVYNAEVRGFVEIVEPRAKGGQRVTLRVVALGDLAPAALPHRVRVRIMRKGVAPEPGQAIAFKAVLAPPAAPAIPGGYDFGRAAWYSGIGGVGYAVGEIQPDRSAAPMPFDLYWWAAIEGVRQSMSRRITSQLGGDRGAIAAALITGERGAISDQANDAFRDSGLLHILSISGLHMVVMAGAVFFLVRFVCAAFPAIALRYSTKKWAAVAAGVAAVCYMLLAGAPFATVRSAIMILIMFVAVLLDRPALALRNVALAALAILALFPESLLDVGFQMSFAAVLALVAGYVAVRSRLALGAGRPQGLLTAAALFVGGIVLSTLIASVAVAPFAAYHFHKSQQYALLANALAIPACNVVVMPAALATLVLMPLGLEAPALAVMGFGIDYMLWCARWVAGLPGAVARIPAMPVSAFALMVFGGLAFLLLIGRGRYAGLGMALIGLALAPTLRLPDLLVGRDGRLVAMRGEDGRLGVIDVPQSRFEIGRWLEHDGDSREVREATAKSHFRCDSVGCTGALKGMTVSASKHPAAFRDDCQRAAILLLSVPTPSNCGGPRHVVDFFAVRTGGTHAIYVDDNGTVRIETVEQTRGRRPWSAARITGDVRAPRIERPAEAGSRLSRFAAPKALVQSRIRPEVEDDEEHQSITEEEEAQ